MSTKQIVWALKILYIVDIGFQENSSSPQIGVDNITRSIREFWEKDNVQSYHVASCVTTHQSEAYVAKYVNKSMVTVMLFTTETGPHVMFWIMYVCVCAILSVWFFLWIVCQESVLCLGILFAVFAATSPRCTRFPCCYPYGIYIFFCSKFFNRLDDLDSFWSILKKCAKIWHYLSSFRVGWKMSEEWAEIFLSQ